MANIYMINADGKLHTVGEIKTSTGTDLIKAAERNSVNVVYQDTSYGKRQEFQDVLEGKTSKNIKTMKKSKMEDEMDR